MFPLLRLRPELSQIEQSFTIWIPNTSDEMGIHEVSAAITPHGADSQTLSCCNLADHLCGSKINRSEVTGRRSAFVVLQNNVTSSARMLFRNHLSNMSRTRHVGGGPVRACAPGRRLKVETPVPVCSCAINQLKMASIQWQVSTCQRTLSVAGRSEIKKGQLAHRWPTCGPTAIQVCV